MLRDVRQNLLEGKKEVPLEIDRDPHGASFLRRLELMVDVNEDRRGSILHAEYEVVDCVILRFDEPDDIFHSFGRTDGGFIDLRNPAPRPRRRGGSTSG